LIQNIFFMTLKMFALVPLFLWTACNSDGVRKLANSADSDSNARGDAFRAANVQERLQHSRAVEAVIWGMPIVNFDLMYQSVVRDANGGYNSVVYWSKLQDWHLQTLTPNPDVCYFSAFFNLKESGPMVLEIPPTSGGVLNGTVMDCWQSAIEDVGIAGVDKGKGGKYFIVPPGYKEKMPIGYIPMESDTYQGYFLIRSILGKNNSDEEVAKAVAYGKEIKFYPFSQHAHSPTTAFIDMAGRLYDAVIPYDIRFYQSLDRMIQSELWLTRDKAMIDQLKYFGIEKGKPFDPDTKMQGLLKAAVMDAHGWLAYYYENAFPPYFNATHWAVPLVPGVAEGMAGFFMKDPNAYLVDGRGLAYSYAYFSPKHPGAGQFYLISIRDKDGNFLDCNKTYRLNVPAHAPVNQYWSATVYNRETHTLIRHAKVLSRSSQSQGLQTDTDGGVNIFFGQKAPTGKEANFVETGNGKNFEVLFRFYGPEKALFTKAWKMPDIEEIK
jgi:hypothetical protein